MSVLTTDSLIQYTGTGAVTVFAVPFPFLESTDLVVTSTVISTGISTTKALTTDYTVSGGSGSTGSVTMLVAPASTVRLTIERVVALTQEVDLIPDDDFNPETIESSLDKSVMSVQQVYDLANRGIHFPSTDDASTRVTELPSSVDRAGMILGFDEDGNLTTLDSSAEGSIAAAVAAAASATASASSASSSATAAAASAASVSLPASPVSGDILYHNGSAWVSLAKGTASQLLQINAGATAPEWATRPTLPTASVAQGDIVYYNGSAWVRLAKGAANQILQMNSGATAPEWVSASSAGFSTGDRKETYKTTADSGWVMMDDGTIGDASSGATTRANADTEALFTLLWNNTVDADCAVSTGRGANAAADFAAHKTIALPKVLGRASGCAGAGSGLTSRALGKTVGTETHPLVTAELAAHTHQEQGSLGLGGPLTPLYYATGGSGTVLNYLTAASMTTANQGTWFSLNTASTGSGTAHNNMQPTGFCNLMIKL